MIKAVIFDMYETLITLFECPVYFGKQMAEDSGIKEEKFREIWDRTEKDRTIGKLSLEETLKTILLANNCYSEELMSLMVNKRHNSRTECFLHLHPEIIPLLKALKEHKLKVGLISNCFSEEAIIIRQSILAPFFDTMCLSYEQGVMKPEEQIYCKCMKDLSVLPKECLYIGDGGSHELEAASFIGMKAMQATWYLKSGTTQPVGRMKEFEAFDTPLKIIEYISQLENQEASMAEIFTAVQTEDIEL